jgi:hypothetical protein
MANEISYIQSPFNKSRKDKFLIVLNLPSALKQISSKFERSESTIQPDTLQFSVYGSVVPSLDIPPVNVRYAGQTMAVSTHSRQPYEPNTVRFTVDNRFNNYWVIYRWLNLLNDDKEGVYDHTDLTSSIAGGDRTKLKALPNMEYRSDISIFALDEYNKRIIEFLYTNAFPINLGGIEYSYRDSGEIESSFTYSYSQLIVKPVPPGIESL